MSKKKVAGLLKISELAKATETKITTIKYYIKEGLIQAVSKTSPNMAYYHPDCIARVQLIKSLQKDHYYPLSVIKHMLTVSNHEKTELALLDVIHKADYRSGKRYTFSEVSRMTRFTRKQVDSLADAKIVKPFVSGKRQWYSESDLQIFLLIRRRQDAGIPFEESVSAFRFYRDSLESAVRNDVDTFISQSLMCRTPSTEEAVRMISVSDETLDLYVNLKRKEFNREFGSERLELLDRFSAKLAFVLEYIADRLEENGATEVAAVCRGTLKEAPEGSNLMARALQFFHSVIHSMKGSLVTSISVCGQAHTFFSELLPREMRDAIECFILYALKYSWMSLAPPPLEYGDAITHNLKDFREFVSESKNDVPKKIIDGLLTVIDKQGERYE